MNLLATAVLFPGLYENELLPGKLHYRVGLSLSVFPRAVDPELAGLIRTATAGQESLFLEMMFAVHFAIRNLSNLGKDSKEASALHRRLQRILYQEGETETSVLDLEVTVSTTNQRQQDGKRITAEISADRDAAKLSLSYAGFGLLHWKVWPYIPSCVMAVFVGVASLHPENRSFVRRVAWCCHAVANAWETNQINLTNHAQLATSLCLAAWSVADDALQAA